MRTDRKQPLPAVIAVHRIDTRESSAPGAEPARDDPESVIASLSERLYELTGELSDSELSALYRLLDSSASPDALEVLSSLPATAILDPAELAVFETLCMEPAPTAGGLRPAVVVIMKTTRLCNLRCSYCYQWRDGPNQIMSFEVMARAIRDVLRCPDVSRAEFVWHGGEPTLLSIDLYRKALWLQQRFRRENQRIDNSMQTNAVRMTDQWVEFWRTHRFSIGVSLDGPPEINDARRVDVAGRPTSERIARSLKRLRRAGIDHGVLMVVDHDTVAIGPQRLLDYLVQADVRQIDLLNVLPGNTGTGKASSGAYIAMPQYVEFLRGMFEAWWPRHASTIAIRELSGLVQQLSGGPAVTCVFAGNCFGGFLTVDPSGAVSACDKYDGDENYRFGDLGQQSLSAIGKSARLEEVRAENTKAVDRMRGCQWFDICHGGCPHDRYTGLRHLRSGTGDRCCGMGLLFERISEALAAAGRSLSPVARSWLSARAVAVPDPVTSVVDEPNRDNVRERMDSMTSHPQEP